MGPKDTDLSSCAEEHEMLWLGWEDHPENVAVCKPGGRGGGGQQRQGAPEGTTVCPAGIGVGSLVSLGGNSGV